MPLSLAYPTLPQLYSTRARVLNQLVDLGLICEDYGGETQVVEVSGRSGEGLDSLVESLLLQVNHRHIHPLILTHDMT